jgi:hypothetical protein
MYLKGILFLAWTEEILGIFGFDEENIYKKL